MTPNVGIIDSRPVFRRGLTAALEEAGLHVRELEPDTLDAAPCAAVLVAIRSPDDQHLLADLGREQPAAEAIVVLTSPKLHDYAEALRLGSCAVVADTEPLEEIVEVVRAALAHRARLPANVVRLFASGRTSSGSGVLTSAENDWLRALSKSVTVAELAESTGYSEREMYRCLRRVYRRMGVGGRAEALVLAGKWGLVG